MPHPVQDVRIEETMIELYLFPYLFLKCMPEVLHRSLSNQASISVLNGMQATLKAIWERAELSRGCFAWPAVLPGGLAPEEC